MKKEEKVPVYIICPRCELNYIGKKDKLCNVCKAEIGLIDPSILIPDDELAGEKLCPVCSVNYIGEDEEICFLCVKERDEKILKSDVEWGFEEENEVDADVDEVIADIVVEEDELPFIEEMVFDEDEVFDEEEEIIEEASIEDDFEYLEDDFDDYDDDEDFDEDEDDDDF